jgi:hypothetical protein
MIVLYVYKLENIRFLKCRLIRHRRGTPLLSLGYVLLFHSQVFYFKIGGDGCYWKPISVSTKREYNYIRQPTPERSFIQTIRKWEVFNMIRLWLSNSVGIPVDSWPKISFRIIDNDYWRWWLLLNASLYEYQERIQLDKASNTRKVFHINYQKMGSF